jgi:D-alanyl-D-alanine-carboxypeptidase/D-alanyl-D-alanine-endopeptidase
MARFLDRAQIQRELTRIGSFRPNKRCIMQRILGRVAVIALAAGACLESGRVAGQDDFVSLEQEIQAALVNRVDEAQNAVGIVVGILTPEGKTFLHYGFADRESGIEPGPNTLFKISGVTSVFSSLLLADMAVHGELTLADPISAFLPASVEVPTFEGQEITLADLAMGTSGLPMRPQTYRGPPSGFRLQDIYDSLSSFSLTRAPGQEMAGSVFEEALLVDILSRSAGVGYEELMRTRVFDQLGMTSTTYELSEDQRTRAAATYNRDFNLRPPASYGALDMGVGLYSTAEDLLTFAAAFMGMRDNPLAPAMRQMLSVSQPVSGHRSASNAHLGWLSLAGGEVYFRSTGGSNQAASVAVSPERQRAVVVLVNNPVEIDSIESISLHGVIPERPLLMYPPKQALTEVKIDQGLLDAYVGEYRVDPDESGLTYTMLLSVRREGDQLVLTRSRLVNIIPGPVINEFELGAMSETEFFARGSENWKFAFHANESGDIAGVTIIRPPGNPLTLGKVDAER